MLDLFSPFPTVLVTIVVILLIYLKIHGPRTVYPDGPFSLPVFGNLHQIILAGNLVKFFKQCRRKYGNVYTIEIGGTKRVVVAGLPHIHQLLVKCADISSNRPSTLHFITDNDKSSFNSGKGIVWSSYPDWKVLRTFALSTLKDQGLGKMSFEPRIHEEIQAYFERFIYPNLNQPMTINQDLGKVTANIICVMVFGHRYDYDDTTLCNLVKHVQLFVSATFKAALTSNIPFLKYVPGDLTAAKQMEESSSFFRPTIQKIIDEHRATLDRDNPRDYIDHFLIQMESHEKSSTFTNGNLQSTTVQLFVGGTDTTSAALQWCLLYMCKYPHIQQKAQKEIEAVVGYDRLPSLANRKDMPYTNAVLTEMLRITVISETGLVHTVDQDVTIDGKVIPQGVPIMFDMASVQYDEETFENPKEFKPERFLNEDDATRAAKSIPFGTGRRQCLGEALAKTEIFLFFTAILQRYSVSGGDGDILSTKGSGGTVNKPPDFNIVFKERMAVA